MTIRTLTVAALATAGLGLAATQAQAAQRINITGKVNAPDGDGSGETLHQSGPFHGAPLGSGTMKAAVVVGRGKGATVKFRLINRRGQVWGTGNVKLTFRGARIVYNGTARITGGSGAFSRIRGNRLRLTGGGNLTATHFPLRLTGLITR
jgi:hypothetical protein